MPKIAFMKENKKEQIVLAALDLLQSKGYTATGINEIIEKSGCPRGSLYHYFKKGKDEIIREALLLYGTRLNGFLETAAGETKNLSGYLRLLYGYFMENLVSADFGKTCPIASTALETINNEAITETVHQVYSLWKKTVSRNLSANKISQPDKTADVLFSMLEGALLSARIQKNTEPLENAMRFSLLLLKQ